MADLQRHEQQCTRPGGAQREAAEAPFMPGGDEQGHDHGQAVGQQQEIEHRCVADVLGAPPGGVNDRGNGVYVWNAPGLLLEDNDIRFGKDGVFVNTSHDDTFRHNRFRDLRFAVHYMYTHASRIEANVSIGNHLGYAVMSSDRVQVTGNISIDDRDHGIMLNYTNSSTISGNLVLRTADKCLFIYNAHKNTIAGNRFEGCGIGIHFTAGSERTAI